LDGTKDVSDEKTEQLKESKEACLKLFFRDQDNEESEKLFSHMGPDLWIALPRYKTGTVSIASPFIRMEYQ
jgi:hypothetical protein